MKMKGIQVWKFFPRELLIFQNRNVQSNLIQIIAILFIAT